MIQVRCGVFETNSSSSHAIVVCTDEKYRLLEDGKAFIHKEEVVTFDEAKKMAKSDKCETYGEDRTPEQIDAMTIEEFAEWLYDTDLDLCTFDSFKEEHWYPFHKVITAESGEVFHVFGSYE